MRNAHSFVLPFAILAMLSAGCAEEAPTPAASAPAVTPAAPAAPDVGEAGPASAGTSRLLPEDQVLDADREAPVRKLADELKAIRPEAAHGIKVGEEAVVLVRGRAQGAGSGALYGSGPYTHDSSFRTSAVHAGLLGHDELGLVRVRMIKHNGNHESELRNGIRPHPWGEYHASYTLEKIEAP